MPFQVSPSKSVIISDDEVGPDDFLLITNEDKTYLYVKISQTKWTHLVLDPELLPAGFDEVVDRAARSVIHSLTGTARDADAFRALFEEREDQTLSLREFIASQLLTDVSVNVVVARHSGQTNQLDIGRTVRLLFPTNLGSLHLRYDRDSAREWVASAQINRITPIARFDALVREARIGP